MRRFLIALLLSTSGCNGASVLEDNNISEAKRLIKDNLKDPYSAQFKDVKFCPSNREIVVGEVNSKNSFGAYAGYEIFFVVRRMPVMSEGIFETRAADLGKSYINHLMDVCYGKAKLIEYLSFINTLENEKKKSDEIMNKASKIMNKTVEMMDQAAQNVSE